MKYKSIHSLGEVLNVNLKNHIHSVCEELEKSDKRAYRKEQKINDLRKHLGKS